MSNHVFLVWGRPSMTSPILWEKHPKSTIHVLFPVLSQNLSVICTNLEKTFTTFTFEYKDSNLRLILQVFISFFSFWPRIFRWHLISSELEKKYSLLQTWILYFWISTTNCKNIFMVDGNYYIHIQNQNSEIWLYILCFWRVRGCMPSNSMGRIIC